MEDEGEQTERSSDPPPSRAAATLEGGICNPETSEQNSKERRHATPESKTRRHPSAPQVPSSRGSWLVVANTGRTTTVRVVTRSQA
ncbi:hypothetical protein L226DRAFT_529008 [Lentinus tigrinus ALCF2SS1-7]|uniref:uncharacterized protein n=1 Tax=Lentinus tigrinus ALCF2SS1-7 TaxID=1328758 RepID=UPI001165E53F|nr:hypothetical protein L226DRAFT_529008 [Lentinus tigrinus ALCF2SS1-7]